MVKYMRHTHKHIHWIIRKYALDSNLLRPWSFQKILNTHKHTRSHREFIGPRCHASDKIICSWITAQILCACARVFISSVYFNVCTPILILLHMESDAITANWNKKTEKNLFCTDAVTIRFFVVLRFFTRVCFFFVCASQLIQVTGR